MKSDFPPLSDFLPEHLKEPKQPDSKKLEKLEKKVEQRAEVSSGRVSKGHRKPVKNKGHGKKSGGLILSPYDPMTSARRFISHHSVDVLDEWRRQYKVKTWVEGYGDSKVKKLIHKMFSENIFAS